MERIYTLMRVGLVSYLVVGIVGIIIFIIAYKNIKKGLNKQEEITENSFDNVWNM